MATGRKSPARTLLNLVLVLVCLTFGGLIVLHAARSANHEADLRIVSREAESLYAAFENYYTRHHAYPNASVGRPFDVTTLDPLFSRGYYRGVLLAKMRGRRADAYDSPDDRGPNREFWIEMTLASDPAVRVLVAKSDDAPMSGGEWCEGAYLYRNGRLEPL